jgi:hypothetical protein
VNTSLTRFALLLVLGAVLAPVSGYFAGLVLGQSVVIWFFATVFGAFAGGLKGILVMLALPGVFGAQWAWPVTCVIFPLVALFVRGSFHTSFLFAAIGAVSGAAAAYGWLASGLKPLQSDLASYLLAGGFGCLCVGAIFGFVLWRIDVLLARPSAAS